MDKGYPPMSANQRMRAKELVRQECCNYLDGMCVVLENGYGDRCVQCISRHVACRWFRDAVLPLGDVLEQELYRKDTVRSKQCVRCGTVFVPGSNRARFCKECAVLRRRRKEAERQRKRRHRSTHIETVEVP